MGECRTAVDTHGLALKCGSDPANSLGSHCMK